MTNVPLAFDYHYKLIVFLFFFFFFNFSPMLLLSNFDLNKCLSD